MKVVVINCGSKKTPHILEVLKDHEIVEFQNGNYDVNQLYKADCVIISGAPIMVCDEVNQKMISEFSWVRSFQKPILGICFGHQVLGMHFGALPYKCPEDRNDQNIEWTKKHPLIEGLPNPCIMNEDHCEAITLPNGFERLGSSTICQNEAMVHFNQPFAGVQFHPETSGELGEQLIKNFIQHYC